MLFDHCQSFILCKSQQNVHSASLHPFFLSIRPRKNPITSKSNASNRCSPTSSFAIHILFLELACFFPKLLIPRMY
jgi:hypothetical protein